MHRSPRAAGAALRRGALPAGLARAFAAEQPGPALPPGPRTNPWADTGAEQVLLPEHERALLDGLWQAGGVHRRPDGTPTQIPRRPVPSAGAAYPVQTHLVVDSGTGTLEAGHYVHDRERGTLRRRGAARERAAGWAAAAPSGPPRFRVVFTVQPGRSFGRYRHRAWPLWIADTAYALAAAEFLCGPAAVRLGPGPSLRALLGVPPAAEPERWSARGLAPEIPLAAAEFAGGWRVRPERRAALAARRSPGPEEFASAARTSRARFLQAAEACGQHWVAGARALPAWSVAADAPVPRMAAVLWRAHRSAAALCYAGALSGRWRSRPVSGFTARGGRWTVHALAVLPGARAEAAR
ncbi:nitroreductase family protein [Nocardiopsis coralliicola]